MRPVDAISRVEAARILGCSRSTVAKYVREGRLHSAGTRPSLSCAAVEQLALSVYPWRRDLRGDASYWVTGQRASGILGVNVARLNQLANAGRLPFETHEDGTRLYRRDQLRTVANAREARWH